MLLRSTSNTNLNSGDTRYEIHKIFHSNSIFAWDIITVSVEYHVLRTAGLTGRAVCGRSPAETVSSNPTGGMDVCLSGMLCVVR